MSQFWTLTAYLYLFNFQSLNKSDALNITAAYGDVKPSTELEVFYKQGFICNKNIQRYQN